MDTVAAAPAKPLNKRQQAKARTHARVLAAATALFREVGYADATIRDIARAAGMSTGAVFANFEDKAALWSAAFKGPPPSPHVADELARILGELPGHGLTLSCHQGRWAAVINTPDFNPEAQTGRLWSAKAEGPAAALRGCREAAQADPTHGVRQPEAA